MGVTKFGSSLGADGMGEVTSAVVFLPEVPWHRARVLTAVPTECCEEREFSFLVNISTGKHRVTDSDESGKRQEHRRFVLIVENRAFHTNFRIESLLAYTAERV